MRLSLVLTVQAGERKGWTGFTWDRHLFPNPKLFLDWYELVNLKPLFCVSKPVESLLNVGLGYRCKAKGIKNTVNCHPASGSSMVCSCDLVYL